jgi:hypothetical protein
MLESIVDRLKKSSGWLHALSGRIWARAIRTSCFDGILSSLLRFGCGDFSFLIRFPLVEKAQQLL